MFVLRCTAKLLKRLEVQRNDSEATSPTTTRLGDWIANFITLDRRPCVIAVSRMSLLPVLVALAPAKTFVRRFPDAVEEMLRRLSLNEEDVAAEREAMNVCVVEPANVMDRVVLGSLNDFARMVDHHLEPSLVDAALKLSRAPCSPLKMENPRDVARALFALLPKVST